MSERTSYAPGTPCWVDLGSPDLDASVEFYGGAVRLGGAGARKTSSRPAATGGRRRTGRDVAGMMPLMQEGQPPAWSTYVSVADADATAAAVTEAGGSVLAEPMDVMDLGRMAVFADPDRSRLRHLAAGHVPRRRHRQRARRARLERAQHPRPRGRQGVLRRRLRLGLRGQRRWARRAATRRSPLGGDPVGGILDMTSAACRTRSPPTGWSTSRSRTPTRRSRPGQGARRRRDDGADRHPGRPLRDPHRPARRRLRRDRAQRDGAANA